MKRRIIWMALAALALVALAAGVLWPAGPPQIVTLPDGRQYQYAGVTWGTNHSQPRVLARVVDSLPANWAAYARTKLNPRFALVPPTSTPTPALMVWLEPVGSNAPFSTQVGTLGDENGVSSGWPNYFYFNPAQNWLPLAFYQVPRRVRTVECDLVATDMIMDPTNFVRIRFSNPLFGHYPQWQPETLPAVKSAGDLTVRLDSFAAVPHSPIYRTESFFVSIGSPRGTKDAWEVEHAELSDATGNRLGASVSRRQDGTYPMRGALWPGESAWRLKLALKRTSGIPGGDLITFSNLPVVAAASLGPLGASLMTNRSRGTPLVLRNYVSGGNSWVRDGYWVVVDTEPFESPDFAVDIVRVTTDAGDPTPYNGSGQSGQYWHFSSVPAGAKTHTVTVAVQKPRYVEFLVKPPNLSTN
jgi:hypothetical protein